MTDSKRRRRRRLDYPFHQSHRTRWSDNDQYAHVNNAVYYHLFDAIVNTYLVNHCGLEPTHSSQIGLVVASFCEFFAPLSFPDVLDLGLRVTQLGNSSVTYEVAVFKSSVEEPAAVGGYTHVFVDKGSRTSVAMNSVTRAGLQKLITTQGPAAKL